MSVETQIQSLTNAVAGLNAAVANVKTSTDKAAEAVPAEASISNKLVDRAYLAANVKGGAEFRVVTTLPTDNIDEHVVYLLPVGDDKGTEKNYYQEFLYVNGEWELLGEPITIDLSGMVKSVNGVTPDQNGNVQVQADFKYCTDFGDFGDSSPCNVTLTSPVTKLSHSGLGGRMIFVNNVLGACKTFGKCTLILIGNAPPAAMGSLSLALYTDIVPDMVLLGVQPTTENSSSAGVLDTWEITFCMLSQSNNCVACRVNATNKPSPGKLVCISADNPYYEG
jgi:hypothetical protein